MRALGPEFIDITWCVAPRVSRRCRDLTLSQERRWSDIRTHIRNGETVSRRPRYRDMHALDVYKYARGEGRHRTSSKLTPLSALSRETHDGLQQEAKKHGCRNILALRGDPPQGKDEWEAVEGGFVHGIDLVQHIHKHYDDYFDIAVAGFPQNMLLPPEERDLEIQYLKEKIETGVDFIFTQMFYEVDVFIEWAKAIRAAGITIPIVPGIAPIQTWNGFLKATSLAKTKIPQSFMDALEPHKNDDEKVRAIGTKLVADMCRKILDADLGIRGLHFYTMNLEKGTKMLLQELNLVPRVETVKPLPWRQVCTASSLADVPGLFGPVLSPLPRTGDKRTFVPSSGQTARSPTCRVQRTGTSFPMGVLVTRVVRHTANSTATASH